MKIILIVLGIVAAVVIAAIAILAVALSKSICLDEGVFYE